MTDVVEIDGSGGEGGGQILRTALALSLITGRRLRIANIRARRRRPGLAPQHLTAVQASAAVSDARVSSLAVGTMELEFVPGPLVPGRYRFDIGTAGSTALLLHTLYLPLALAAGPSRLQLAGGSHVPWSPTYEYLSACWAPNLRRLGLEVSLTLVRPGFYPRGGAEIVARLRGSAAPRAVQWTRPLRGRRLWGRSLQARLDPEVAVRQCQGARAALARRGYDCPIETGVLHANSPGTAIALVAAGPDADACVTGLGERGKRAEVVGAEAAEAFADLLDSACPVDEHAADQLLLPLALAGAPSAFLTPRATLHLTTNARVIERFLPVRIAIAPDEAGRTRVTIDPYGRS